MFSLFIKNPVIKTRHKLITVLEISSVIQSWFNSFLLVWYVIKHCSSCLICTSIFLLCLLCYQTLVLVFDLQLNIAPYYFGGQDWARKVCRFSVNLFGYLTKWEPNWFETSRNHFDFFDLFFNLFEEERIIILAFARLEPTHLCDPR